MPPGLFFADEAEDVPAPAGRFRKWMDFFRDWLWEFLYFMIQYDYLT